LFDAWHFVTRTPEAVRKVWSDYAIGVQFPGTGGDTNAAQTANGTGGDVSPTQVLGGEDLGMAGRTVERFGGGYEVMQAAPYRFIDPAGWLRAVMEPDVLPADIAGNVKALLRGRQSASLYEKRPPCRAVNTARAAR